MAVLSQQQEYILQLWVMTLFYGIYVVIFSASVYVLAFQERHSSVNKQLLLITISLFVISTAQNIVTFLLSFLTTDVGGSGLYSGETGVVLHEKDINNLLQTINDALMPTNNLIADGLLIWRCYMVWERRVSIIIAPTVLLIAGTVCGYGAMAMSTRMYLVRLHAPLSEPTPLPGWTELQNLYQYLCTAMYATSFVTNITMTILIGSRIWWTTRGARQYFGRNHGKWRLHVAYLMIESGAIYSLLLLLETILFPLPYAVLNAGVDVVQAIIAQIVGIFPTLIIVLVALRKTSDQTNLTTFHAPSSSKAAHTVEFARPSRRRDEGTERHDFDIELTDISSQDPERGYSRKSKASLDIVVIPLESHDG